MARSITLAALALYLLVSGLVAAQAMVLTPYSDMLDWFGRWEGWQADGDLLGFLIAPHNFNRAAGTFGTLALDIAAGGRGHVFVAVGLLSLAGSAVVLGLEARRAAPPPLRLAAGAIAAMLTLMAGNILDAVIPININYAQSLLLAAAAISLAGREQRAARAGALACAILAPFGNAAGFAVWPALVLMAIKGRQWRWLAAVLGVGLAASAAYALGQHPPATHGGGFDLVSAVSLLLHYLGLPWTRGWAPGGALLGAALLAAGLLVLATRGHTPAERVAVGLITFSLVTAALAALGRTGYGPAADVPLRYAVFLAPLHVGLLILALPYAARLPAWTPAALAVGLLLHQVAAGHAAVGTAERNRQLIADFLAGQRIPAMAATIHPDLDHAQRVYQRMAARGLYTAAPVPAKAGP